MSMTKPQEEAEKLAEKVASVHFAMDAYSHKLLTETILREIQPLLTRIEELERENKILVGKLQVERQCYDQLNAVAKAAEKQRLEVFPECRCQICEALTALRESGWRPTE
jgi:hypothetical protein